MITCSCAVCTSTNPRNRRFRPSGLLTLGEKRFLIDAGPDFRSQALAFGIKKLDALVLTHTHFDHIAGIDDLRVFQFREKKPLPCLLSQEAYEDLTVRYPYFFEQDATARFQFQVLKEKQGETCFEGVKWRYFSYIQNGMQVLGYRIGNFAYVLDIRESTEEILKALKGVEILVVSALRHTPSPAHFSLEEAMAFAQQVGAKQTWFSHSAHDLEYEETNRILPATMRLAYDGLEIEFYAE